MCSHPANLFPIGKPKVLIKPSDLEQLKITAVGAYFKGMLVQGSCHCKVEVAPTFYPFLQFNAHGKSFCALCERCVLKKKVGPCKCKKQHRGFKSVWTFPELVQAVKNGDTIVEVYEALIYTKAAAFLKEFLDMLASFKIRHSKFLEADPAALGRVCDKINADMGFVDPELILTPDRLNYDEGQKEFYKLWANALLGKFSQDNEKLFHEIVTNQNDLNKWFNDPKHIVHEIIPIGNVLQLGIRPNKAFTRPNLSSQVVVGAYVTAYARIEMFSSLKPVLEKGAILCYTDTDSAILKMPRGMELDLPFGNSYREWKNELPPGAKLTEYFGLGPKSYGLGYEKDNILHSVVKCKGFSLKGNKSVQLADIKRMVEKRQIGIDSARLVPQFNIRIDKKHRKLYNAYSLKRLSSQILTKRVLLENRIEALPFGYNKAMAKSPFMYDK